MMMKNRLNPHGMSELRSQLNLLNEPGLVYVDAGSWRGTPETLITSVGKGKFVFLGIIDSGGTIKNPMALMHKGCVDYIGQKELASELTKSRCSKVVSYIKRYRSDFEAPSPLVKKKSANGEDYIPVARGWQDVKLNKKYTFAIMFIEVDDREEMEKL